MDRFGYARDYHRLGYRLVLLHRGTKEPIHRGFPDLTPDEDEIRYAIQRQCANYGILLAGLLVGDKDDRDQQANLFVRRTGLFYSPQVTVTPHGKHYYSRLPAGMEVKSRIRFRSWPLDILSGHSRFGMGPGSVFEGHTYGLQGKIVPPDELPVAREALVTLLTRREEVRARIETACCLPDESAVSYLEKVAPAEQGNNGSRAAFVAALKCLTLAAGDERKAWEFLVYFNRTRCFPPFDEEIEDGPDSLLRKLREAAKVWKPR